MTEYTGWDNYVKEQAIREQEEYILGPIIREDPDKWLFNQLNDRVKKLEGQKDDDGDVSLDGQPLFMTQEVVEKLRDKVKDLEESDKGNRKRMDGHHESIMELEEEITKTAQYAGGLYSDLEQKVKDLIKGQAEFYKKIKDIEEWKNSVPDVVIKSVTNLKEKVKDLEDRQATHTFKVDNLVSCNNGQDGRIKDLEEQDKLKDDNLHSLYWQIKHLEEWKDGNEETFDHIHERLKRLEEWKNDPSSLILNGNTVLKRVQALEEWKVNHHKQSVGHVEAWWLDNLKKQVDKLEEWKENVKRGGPMTSTVSDFERRMKLLEEWKTKHSNLDNDAFNGIWHAIRTLEEWKARYIKELGDNPDARLEDVKPPYERWIPIDKKVWEDIKHSAELFDNVYVSCDSFAVERFHRLKEAIKKADPSWCDKD